MAGVAGGCKQQICRDLARIKRLRGKNKSESLLRARLYSIPQQQATSKVNVSRDKIKVESEVKTPWRGNWHEGCRKCHLFAQSTPGMRLAADHLLTASGLLKPRLVDEPCGSAHDPLERRRREWDWRP